MLETPEGMSSGGMIDSGLASYIETYGKFRNRPDVRISRQDIDEAGNIRWTGVSEFSAASGTGYYFPLIYTPQAIGLMIGEKLGLTVDTSYRMARLSVLASASLIILLAFFIYRPPFIAAALLVLPMSLFQFASATLDGISTALFVLAVSCFARIAVDKELSKRYLTYLILICVLLITSSRAHALPIFALVFASYFYTKDKRALVGGFVSVVLVMAWLAASIKMTSNIQFKAATPASTIAIYYLTDPGALVKVIYRTLADEGNRKFYLESFVGILGWLDTRFPNIFYGAAYASLAYITLLSLLTTKLKGITSYRALLILCAFGSTALIFVALLIQWNAAEHPALTIQGIQGRYLLFPALLLAYSIGTERNTTHTTIQNLGFGAVFALLLFASYCTSLLMINRFYLSEAPQHITTAKVTPSAQLSEANPAKLTFDRETVSRSMPLRSISIMFATYARINSGQATVALVSVEGVESNFNLDLSSIQDNKYHTIHLDNRAYSSGEVRVKIGGGVSIWQAEYEPGSIASCIIYEFSNGSKRYTKGCPRS